MSLVASEGLRRLAIKNRPSLGDRLGFKNRVGLDVTDKYFSPAALSPLTLMWKFLGVIPAKAGIQSFQAVLDPGFRRGDAVGQRDFPYINSIAFRSLHAADLYPGQAGLPPHPWCGRDELAPAKRASTLRQK